MLLSGCYLPAESISESNDTRAEDIVTSHDGITPGDHKSPHPIGAAVDAQGKQGENGGQGQNRTADTGIFRASKINNLLISLKQGFFGTVGDSFVDSAG